MNIKALEFLIDANSKSYHEDFKMKKRKHRLN